MDFRDRAWFEAERYGADPWIFVRELLQNGRDAGASNVALTISERDGWVRLVCRDDGDGMTEEHARQFLFRLYASSKENEAGMAGRFGVGFWSILRFDPSQIVIRSWPREGKPWEVTLDGTLKHAQTVPLPEAPRGTELVLTRVFTPSVAEQVKRAARLHGRYLMTRANRAVPLEVTVDGERITEELQLPAPSATFQRRGVRGVVALGATPQVELFSKGLHVRTAASVDELLASPEQGKSRQLDPLLEGLAPQVILDGDELDLMRSRSDARDDGALRRAVELSQKELARLVERQLQFSRPVPLWKRVMRPLIATAALATFVAGGARLVSSLVRQRSAGPVYRAPLPDAVQAPVPEAVPYRDPADGYRGPRTDALPATTAPADLVYWPASKTLFLSALHLQRPEDPPRLEPGAVRQPYREAHCFSDCVRISLSLEAQPGWVRLPVPSGHVLDVRALTWNGEPRDVYRTPQGEPVIRVDAHQRANVSYKTGPGVPYVDAPLRDREVPRSSVPDVSRLEPYQRVARLRDWVAERVQYSNDPEVGERHRKLERRGFDFVTRSLMVGAGDCDVQNALLALLLQEAGVPARLAVGHVGRNGRAEPLLHAWVEYQLDGAAWQVTDASMRGLRPPAVAGVSSSMRRYDGDTWEEGLSEPQRALVPKRRDTPRGSVMRPVEPSTDYLLTVPAWSLPRQALGLLGAAPLLALALVVLRPRVKRQVQLDEEHDLSRLLQGALARPEAFHHVPALFEQPLVPKRGGGAISLARAYQLAAAERLYSSDIGAPFTERAVKSGAVVLDAMRPEGRVVAEALGAVNLDRWDRLLRVAQIPALLARVNEHLRSRGEQWMVMLSDAVVREPAVLRVPGTANDRWIVVNADALWLPRVAALEPIRPARALFTVIDTLALWLRLPSARRARLLSPLARAALFEEAAGPAPAAPVEAAQERVEPQRIESFDDAAGLPPAPDKVRDP